MSETRDTTTIEEIEAPAREPLTAFADVISARGGSACLIAKSAYKGSKAMVPAAQEYRHRQSLLPEIGRIVTSAATAQEAVMAIASMSRLEVPTRQAQALAPRLQLLIARNDKAGVEVVARELITGRQNRLQSQLLPIITQSCQAIGFSPAPISAANGFVVAHRDGSRQKLTIEVAKTKDGGVKIHFDAHGFEGNVCVETLDSLAAEMRARGVRCDLHERRRKHSRPVYDRNRLGQRLNNGLGS